MDLNSLATLTVLAAIASMAIGQGFTPIGTIPLNPNPPPPNPSAAGQPPADPPAPSNTFTGFPTADPNPAPPVGGTVGGVNPFANPFGTSQLEPIPFDNFPSSFPSTGTGTGGTVQLQPQPTSTNPIDPFAVFPTPTETLPPIPIGTTSNFPSNPQPPSGTFPSNPPPPTGTFPSNPSGTISTFPSNPPATSPTSNQPQTGTVPTSAGPVPMTPSALPSAVPTSVNPPPAPANPVQPPVAPPATATGTQTLSNSNPPTTSTNPQPAPVHPNQPSVHTLAAAAFETLVTQSAATFEALRTGYTTSLETILASQRTANEQFTRRLDAIEAQVANISIVAPAPVVNSTPNPMLLEGLRDVTAVVNAIRENLTMVEASSSAAGAQLQAFETAQASQQASLQSALGAQAGLNTAVQQITSQLSNVFTAVSSINTRPTLLQGCDVAQFSDIWTFSVVPNVRFEAMCDQTTSPGGWMVIQRRTDDTENFFRSWADYKEGFGSRRGDYWLGNRHLHDLTKSGTWILRVELTQFNGSAFGYAEYRNFRISSEHDGYRLTVGHYSGTIGNALSHHNGRRFSTHDRDNDAAPSANCAAIYQGGWWYEACYDSNLNGPYRNQTYLGHVAIRWHGWGPIASIVPLREVRMMIRREVTPTSAGNPPPTQSQLQNPQGNMLSNPPPTGNQPPAGNPPPPGVI